MNKNDCIEIIRQKLTAKRFEHSLRVAEQAVSLALRFGADPEKAELAGLLHDIMKDESVQNQLIIIDRHGIMLSAVEKKEPKLLHAIAGAAYVQSELGISDQGIIDAIRWHTTARQGMSLLEKVLFLADFTSADRDFDGLAGIRAALDTSLEAGMLAALVFNLRDRVSLRRVIHPDALNAYNQAVGI